MTELSLAQMFLIFYAGVGLVLSFLVSIDLRHKELEDYAILLLILFLWLPIVVGFLAHELDIIDKIKWMLTPAKVKVYRALKDM